MTNQPAARGITWRLAGAWALALAGLVWAGILNFAGSMRTVPSMSIGEALLATPLPVLALLLVRSAVVRGREGNGRPVRLFWSIPPVVLALLGLFFGWSLFLRLGLS